MIKNYFKVATRYLLKHKGYTFINVAGLSVAIACCLLIMLFVKSEWSFDRFHSKSDRIYRAWLEEHYQGEILRNTATPIPLGPVLKAGLPEAESSCRVVQLTPPVVYNNIKFNDPVTIVDDNFFDVFDFDLLQGDKKNPFPTANNIIVSKKLAKKYFGNQSPIGKTLEIDLGINKVNFTVSGLAKDPPLESSIQFDALISFANAPNIWNERTITSSWSNVQVSTFILLKKDADLVKANQKIASVMNPLVSKNYKAGEYTIRLQPLKDIHFNSSLPAGIARPSDPKYAYILSCIAILILLIACINFVTLSVGRSATRALEVGVRKVLGAERQQLIRQFWGEALMLTLASLIIGAALAFLMQDAFSTLANRPLHFHPDGFMLLFCICIAAVIALLAGIYPAFVLSAFKPIQVLKGRFSSGSQMGFFRKALVAGQFTASIVMIIGTFSIGKQLQFLRSKDLGYNKEHIVIVETNRNRKEGNALASLYKYALEKNRDILATTSSLYSMGEYGWMSLGYTDDQKVFRSFGFNAVDADFIPAMNLKMVAGRAFSADNPADSGYILVNEALVKEYGWKDAIGKKLPGKFDMPVLGVIKDFNIQTLHAPVGAVVLALKPDSMFRKASDVNFNAAPTPRISVRLKNGNIQDQLASLKSGWKQVAGDEEFDYKFLDETLAAAYEQEQRLAKIVQYASVLSIFIACMGLFGLVTLVVVRRTKEIGIRKVLGADVKSIVALLSREFFILVFIASLIAFPVAWWGLNSWLQDFSYRIHIPWMVFLAASVIALFVALLTVSFQAIKAALTNPVHSLRTE
jgi:putative ABC transport system permease protein